MSDKPRVKLAMLSIMAASVPLDSAATAGDASTKRRDDKSHGLSMLV
jgi:hypothetical protein